MLKAKQNRIKKIVLLCFDIQILKFIDDIEDMEPTGKYKIIVLANATICSAEQ
jgi:hypothetical protein